MKNTTIDINELTIKKFVESLRPEDKEIRKQLDIGYSYDGKIILLYEIRPFWDNPNEIQNNEFAKIRFYKSRREWNLYWMRASGKWEIYEPFPESSYLEKLTEIIKEDKYSCFFG
jgi:hypothetical protein